MSFSTTRFISVTPYRFNNGDETIKKITCSYLTGIICFLIGVTLVLHHYLVYGYLEIWKDIVGHDTYGTILIFLGLIILVVTDIRDSH